MQYTEFLNRVGERIGVDSREEAIEATEATLTTFGQRLDRTERNKLAAQLPNELKKLVTQPYNGQARQRIDRFGLEEFYKRVAARLDTRYTPAENVAKAVISVLEEAVTPGEIDDVLSGISSEYRQLFSVSE